METGANSDWILSYGAADGEDDSSLYLTAMYELKLTNIEKGSLQAKEIETNYTALARGACRDSVEKIRKWKEDGKLEQWKEEDLRLESAADGNDQSYVNSAVDRIDKSSVDSALNGIGKSSIDSAPIQV